MEFIWFNFTCPENVESIDRERTHLAECLSQIFRRNYSRYIFLQAVAAKINKGIENPNKMKYIIFVGDSLVDKCRNKMKHIIAASNAAYYTILCFLMLNRDNISSV